ncbi:serine/threonine protein kinase [Coemansia sp. RSA 922]|nr:serine/threonine protein kinase [Coemansia sp. S3946]KAJ2113222.1 serine/threonine protein kinase [Coemansia sp. RSA 922]
MPPTTNLASSQPSDSHEMDSLNQLFQDQLLVSQVSQSVWGVLLSLSPDDYTTVLMERTKTGHAPTANFGYLIGRHKACDVRINNQHISNRHCLIYRVEDVQSESCNDESKDGHYRVYLEDTSTNGTYVNKVRVDKNATVELHDGDEIQFARYQPDKGMTPFNDRFYVFQNLDIHRREPCLFKQSYYLSDRLGKGAFAEVRVAINRVTGKRYAAKIIKRIEQADKRKKLDDNFQVETSILSRVRYPSIVMVHGVFRERDYLYLVLDLAPDGELFDEIVKREFLAEDDARRVLLQLLLAIRHLNRLGIVHRDIKLENILLADRHNLRIKLADFGLAKIVGETMFMKTVCGTPMYVAPEVLTVRQMGMYDNLVDMWSLGVVLYICLCGYPPFSEEASPPPMRDQIIAGIYSFPSPYWDTVSSEGIDLVCQMLQVDPKNRINVDDALAHPWLRARRTGGLWTIDGVDFAVADPDAFEDTQRTQSLTAESSQQMSQPWSPRSVLSPVSAANVSRFAGAQLPPSSPPTTVVARHVETVAAVVSSASDSEVVAGPALDSPEIQTAAIGVSLSDELGHSPTGSSRKRKDPSFMRSHSDLGQMVQPKRSTHFNHHGGDIASPVSLMPDSGPMVSFEMSPDMSFQQGSDTGAATPVCPPSAKQRRTDVVPKYTCPLAIYPKPLPRPRTVAAAAAVDQGLGLGLLPTSANNRGHMMEVGGVLEDGGMSRQSSGSLHPMTTHLGRKR